MGCSISGDFEILNADFSLKSNGKCDTLPCEVTFNANYSCGDSYEWDFGDGQSYISKDEDTIATHSYDCHGVYEVTLIVRAGKEDEQKKMPVHIKSTTFIKEFNLGDNSTGFDIAQCNNNNYAVLYSNNNEYNVLFIDEFGNEILKLNLNTFGYNLRNIHCTSDNFFVAAMSEKPFWNSSHSIFLKFNSNGIKLTKTINTTESSQLFINDTFLNEDDELIYTGNILIDDVSQPTFGRINTINGELMTFETFYKGCDTLIQCSGRRIIGVNDNSIYTLNLNTSMSANNFFLTRITDEGRLGLEIDELNSDLNNSNKELVSYNKDAIIVDYNSNGNLFFEIFRFESPFAGGEQKLTDEITTFTKPSAKVNSKNQLVIAINNSASRGSNGIINLIMYDLETLNLLSSNKAYPSLTSNKPIDLEIAKDGGYIIMANQVDGEIVLIKTDSQGEVW